MPRKRKPVAVHPRLADRLRILLAMEPTTPLVAEVLDHLRRRWHNLTPERRGQFSARASTLFGTPPVLAFHHYVLENYKRVESWGIYACKKIVGKNEWSQHAWGNAEDWHGPKPVMQAIFNAAVKYHAKFSVATVIYTASIWRHDWPGGVHPYKKRDHADHVHVDFLPEKTGTPPCALAKREKAIEKVVGPGWRGGR